jgi:hypothetical protein
MGANVDFVKSRWRNNDRDVFRKLDLSTKLALSIHEALSTLHLEDLDSTQLVR